VWVVWGGIDSVKASSSEVIRIVESSLRVLSRVVVLYGFYL
jgi:hypothetical protein